MQARGLYRGFRLAHWLWVLLAKVLVKRRFQVFDVPGVTMQRLIDLSPLRSPGRFSACSHQRSREHSIPGDQAAFMACCLGVCDRKSGYQRRKVSSQSSLSTRVRT